MAATGELCHVTSCLSKMADTARKNRFSVFCPPSWKDHWNFWVCAKHKLNEVCCCLRSSFFISTYVASQPGSHRNLFMIMKKRANLFFSHTCIYQLAPRFSLTSAVDAKPRFHPLSNLLSGIVRCFSEKMAVKSS